MKQQLMQAMRLIEAFVHLLVGRKVPVQWCEHAGTDGTVIRLPRPKTAEAAEVALLTRLAMHEAGHLTNTVPGWDGRLTDEECTLFNVLEDPRMEREQCRDYPGAQIVLSRGLGEMLERIAQNASNDGALTPEQAVQLDVLVRGFMTLAPHRPVLEHGPAILAAIAPAIPPESRKAIDEALGKLPCAASSLEAEEIARALHEQLTRAPEPPSEDPPSEAEDQNNQQDPQGQQGEQDQQDSQGQQPGEQDQPDSQGQQPGEQDQQDTRGQQPGEQDQQDTQGQQGEQDQPDPQGQQGEQDQQDPQGQPGKQDQQDSQGQPGKQDPQDSQGQPGEQDQQDSQGQQGEQGQPDSQGQPGGQDQPDSQGQQPGEQDQQDTQGQLGEQDQQDPQGQPADQDQQDQPGKPDQQDQQAMGPAAAGPLDLGSLLRQVIAESFGPPETDDHEEPESAEPTQEELDQLRQLLSQAEPGESAEDLLHAALATLALSGKPESSHQEPASGATLALAGGTSHPPAQQADSRLQGVEARLVAVLRRELQDKKRRPARAAHAGQRVIPSRFWRLQRLGDTRVFAKRSVVNGIDAAATLLLDTSYSMESQLARAVEVTMAFSLALQRLGIRTKVARYPGTETITQTLQQFGESPRVCSERVNGLTADGGTPTGVATMTELPELLAQRRLTNFLALVTDGDAADPDLFVAALKQAREAGVRVIGVGIGCDISTSIPASVEVNNVQELPDALARLFRENIAQEVAA